MEVSICPTTNDSFRLIPQDIQKERSRRVGRLAEEEGRNKMVRKKKTHI